MAQAFIALGANLGEARKALQEVVARINEEESIVVTQCSSFYKTTPIDSSGPDYINGVIKVETTLSPEDLLSKLLLVNMGFHVRFSYVFDAFTSWLCISSNRVLLFDQCKIVLSVFS